MTGTDVRDIMERLGLTGQQFADLLGVHPSTVHRWVGEKNAERSMSIEPLQQRLMMLLRQLLTNRDDEQCKALGSALADAISLGGSLRALYALLTHAYGDQVAA